VIRESHNIHDEEYLSRSWSVSPNGAHTIKTTHKEFQQYLIRTIIIEVDVSLNHGASVESKQ
jgi:hypothetical protein